MLKSLKRVVIEEVWLKENGGVLLSSLLALQQANQVIVVEYRHLRDHRWLLLKQIMDTSRSKTSRSERKQR